MAVDERPKDVERVNEMQLKLVEPIPDYFGQTIRVLVDEANDNAPWFVVVDICAVEDDAVKQATRDRYDHYLALSDRVARTLRSKLAERHYP